MPHLRISVLLLGSLLALSGCGPEVLKATPAPLLGRWETQEASHADRWFEIREQDLSWGMGVHRVYHHPIRRVEFEQGRDGRLVYTFHYANEEEGFDDSVRVRTRPGLDPVIAIGSQETEWRRVP